MSQDEQVAKCPQCGGPLRPYHEGLIHRDRLKWARCDYCGYYVKEGFFDKVVDEAKEVHEAVGTTGSLGLSAIGIAIFFGITLLFLSFFSTSAIWPASNQTAITTQLQQAVETGSRVLPIFMILGVAGLILVFLGREHHLESR